MAKREQTVTQVNVRIPEPEASTFKNYCKERRLKQRTVILSAIQKLLSESAGEAA